MDNTCYVIMPYGGEDEKLKAKYRGIYNSIIRPAAQRAGFDARIEPDTDMAGTITRNIVQNLSSCSLVIADLTGMNPNVYYELGLSHVFHKNSTVIICEKGTEVKFDVVGAKRVEYITDISEQENSITMICEEIRTRMSGRAGQDNVVHEVLTELPDHLVGIMEQDENHLQTQLDEVIRERDALKAQLQAAGIRTEARVTETRSVRTILTRAKQRMKYAGTSLIDTLRKYADADDMDNFLDYLIDALELGTPTLSNINNIVEICSTKNNDVLLEDVLCASRVLYPDDPELMTRLAKLYARRPTTQMEAMRMVNEAIGLEMRDGNYVMADKSKLSHNELARFLDTYLAMESYDGLVQAATVLMDHVHEQEQEMLNRNIFIALTRKGDLDRAAEKLPLIEAMDTDISKYLIANYYNRCGDFVKEYEYLEQAFILDPEDLDYPRMLAAHILNEDLVRTPNGICKVKPADSRKAAAAMLYYILENGRGDHVAVQRIIDMMQRSRNRLGEYLEYVAPFLMGKEAEPPYDLTDRFSLDYILCQVTPEYN